MPNISLKLLKANSSLNRAIGLVRGVSMATEDFGEVKKQGIKDIMQEILCLLEDVEGAIDIDIS